MIARHSLPVRAASFFSVQGSRPFQEDYVLGNPERGIFVVADGFGGSPFGAQASKVTCEASLEFLEKEAGDLEATLPFENRRFYSVAANILYNAILYANSKLFEKNLNLPIHQKGGASLVAGFLDGELLALASVGNCQSWLMRESQLIPLSVPRSYARLLNPAAEIISSHVDAPLMALGMGEEVQPEICEYRLRPGDRLILATDGLSHPVLEDAVHAFIRSYSAPQTVVYEMTEKLKENLYSDNVAISIAAL